MTVFRFAALRLPALLLIFTAPLWATTPAAAQSADELRTGGTFNTPSYTPPSTQRQGSGATGSGATGPANPGQRNPMGDSAMPPGSRSPSQRSRRWAK